MVIRGFRSLRWDALRGAGIAFAAPGADGRPQVLLGRRRGGPGWTIPFGALEAVDAGDYRNCALRETGLQTCSLGQDEPRATCVRELDRRLPVAIVPLLRRAPRFLFFRYSTFLVRLPRQPGPLH